MNRFRLSHPDRRFLPLFHVCSFLMILLAVLIFGPTPRALATDATITVDANQVKGFINPLVFGHNVYYNAITMWDHRTDSPSGRSFQETVNG